MKANARIVYADGNEKFIPVEMTENGSTTVAVLKKEAIGKNAERIDFCFDLFSAKSGDEGYFVIPGEPSEGVFLTRFTDREDCKRFSFTHMGFCGMRKNGVAVIGIAIGMKYDFYLYAEVKGGEYSLYPRYVLDGDEPYDDISVEYVTIANGDYSAMARVYREYAINRFGCVPLKQRVKDNPSLKKAVDSVEVRVRQAWKPVPSPVEEQTPETEPPVHVACDFSRVGDIVDSLKSVGVGGAEICLVGWNKGGHDGRFPQLFPVEESLGGEKEMLKLIEKTKAAGYPIVCHTDSTAAYRIADCFNEEYLVRNKDGSLMKRPYCWGGGRPYKVCPERDYGRFTVSDIPRLKALGFSGIHYVDVITILPLVKCYSKNHPLDRKGSAEYYRKIMKLCRDEIGGFASEGGFDFAADLLDYCMYTSFSIMSESKGMRDEYVPFWQIAYHGIILYNPGTATLNYPAKQESHRLKYFEYGGRPLAVYYANFAKNNNWMGNEDLLCGTEDELKLSASQIKQMYDDYESLKGVRYEFMDSHEKVADGVYVTTYSNGTKVTVDYNNGTYEISDKS